MILTFTELERLAWAQGHRDLSNLIAGALWGHHDARWQYRLSRGPSHVPPSQHDPIGQASLFQMSGCSATDTSPSSPR